MAIHLHQDLLVRMPLLNLLAEFQSWSSKVTDINDEKIILRTSGNHSAGRVQISGGINVKASHPQHQGAQMLYGAIAVNKQDTGFAFRSSH